MKKGYLYIALTTIIFSTMEIMLKFVAKDFNAIQLNFTRFFVGGIFLIPFAARELKKRKLHIKKSDIGYFAFLGFLGIFISMGLYQLAVMNTKASVVAVLFSSNPVFVTVFAFLLLREVIYKHNVAALILQVIGILAIINPFNVKLSTAGIMLSLASTLTFALYGVCGKKKCARFGGVVVTCFSFILGSLEMLLFIGISHMKVIADAFISSGLNNFANIPLFSGYSMMTIPIIAFICIVNTGLGFACYFLAMEKTSASKTSLVFFFKPMLAPVLALIILYEEIPMNMIAGIAFILAGLLISIVTSLKVVKEEKHIAA